VEQRWILNEVRITDVLTFFCALIIAALNKLEKVALHYARRTSRPLVLILNNVHFFKNDNDGQNMLLQLQQRAESWAASGKSLLTSRRLHVIYGVTDLGILTLVFST